ncbi:hypothetical protein DICVIV_03136 [Dictyocaulus viviparus]|uniref:SXP/RAL-2 family protein Ani s 5-like cation-binding domain-containing protein n=1 Tax=Dictyocaulus viviparus TaxID=29172 RepID=A0A0D8Y803_DICVI|nr:hypothetical protein DICVIV_03136 [Dictyocaulus viviparus]
MLTILMTIFSLTEAQWNVPIVNSDRNNNLYTGQRQTIPSYGSIYEPPSVNYANPLTFNPLAAHFAPQFAQFGSQYPGYSIPSIPTAVSSMYPPSSRNDYNVQPLALPSQITGQFGYQPSIFGTQTYLPVSPKELELGSVQQTRLGNFQSDQFMGTIEKPASLPPLQPKRLIPPFMEKQSKEVQDKFYSIVQHPTWSAAEKNAKIEEMISDMDMDVQNIYARYQHTSSNDVNLRRHRVHEAVERMSPEAQQQFQKVSALFTNPNIPQQQRLAKIEELYSKIPDDIKKEFDSKFNNL